MPPRRSSRAFKGQNGPANSPKPKTIAQRHAEWAGLLRPDGPFIAVPVLAGAFNSYLDTIPDGALDKIRLAWSEVTEAPDTLTPAWCELILTEVLGYNAPVLTEGQGLPSELASGPGIRPDAAAYGPDPSGGRVERLLIYRRPYDEPLTKATRHQLSAAEQAATLCRERGIPLALLTNGSHWVLVHARTGEPTTTADWDADLWLEERDLLRAFYSLLRAPFIAAGRLAELFRKSAEAQAEVTSTLGTQVRQAVELLVGELSRLDRESSGGLLGAVEPRKVYRGALTVMMRLVFLFYAEERRLLPVDSELYADFYSVTSLFDQLQAEQSLHGEQVAGLRAAAWPRLLATFAAIYGGCEHDQMRIPPYGGGMFDPSRYPWLDQVAVTDLVVAEMLRSLLFLQRKGSAERLSYKGLDVEQIGHVYEGLLEYSCLRTDEPYVGLIGKFDAVLPLSSVLDAFNGDNFEEWLTKEAGPTASQIGKALDQPTIDEPTLDAACDNDRTLATEIWPLRGLLRLDLRSRPTVFSAGSLIITQTGDRRATGTHYTPRKLADEIVKYTLEPLCYNPGPANGVEALEANVRPAKDLLELKVLDPAMGSAAFLVSACRYLSQRVVSAWERDGYPAKVLDALGAGFDRDDALLEARRIVAARCLYGVDRDDAAVELGKLSLWLATLAKEQPFSFLDHALRWGDSLVGLTTEQQVVSFHMDPATGHAINARMEGAIDEIAEPIMFRVKELRRQIEEKGPVRDSHMGAELSTLLTEAETLTAKLKTTADVVAGAALSTAGQSEDALDDRLTAVSEEVLRYLHEDTRQSPLERTLRGQVTPWLQGQRAEPIHPFHWPLEFPEVMDEGGFSAVVSNPPFMGGKTLTGRIGEDIREYLVNYIGRRKRGNADLCSYFLLRDLAVARRGRVGIITTNTIAQGDTREIGLDQAISDLNWSIYRADKSQPWPGAAALEVSLLWVGHAMRDEPRILDGGVVAEITSSLDPQSRVTGAPYRLVANMGHSFNGMYVMGTGFVIDSDEASTWITMDRRNKDVLFPYLNGEDLNSRPDCSASRWVINFGDMTDHEACRYVIPWDRVEKQVRPQRMEQNDRYGQEYWWRFFRTRPELRDAITNLDRVLVIAQTSRTQMPALVSAHQVLSHMLTVITTDHTSGLALHSSEFQYFWTARYSAGLKADLRFFPSDCFENFSQPTHTDRMTAAGGTLDEVRSRIMQQPANPRGLTALYNGVRNESNHEPDIACIREIHVEIDEAVREAYALDEEREPQIREFEARAASAPLPSWREIDLAHGFHETPQGTRFTISPQARIDVLDKLLALNHYRYQQEVERGLHNKKPLRKPKTTRTSSPAPGSVDDGALFAPPDALF
jgi:hypothetical protein